MHQHEYYFSIHTSTSNHININLLKKHGQQVRISYICAAAIHGTVAGCVSASYAIAALRIHAATRALLSPAYSELCASRIPAAAHAPRASVLRASN